MTTKKAQHMVYMTHARNELNKKALGQLSQACWSSCPRWPKCL